MKDRVVSALVAIPLVLAAVFAVSPWPLFALAVFATLVCSIELGGLLGGKPTRMPMLGLAACAHVGAYLAGAFGPIRAEKFALANIGLLGSGLIAAATVLWGVRSRLVVEASALWIASPLLALVLLHFGGAPEDITWNLRGEALLALIPIWAGDTAGYVFGKAFGKRLLAPTISPKKTVVGAVAFLLASVAAGWGTAAICEFDPLLGLACGAACGTLGQWGDLFESALKRACGQKDAGSLMPGHGGLLDRVDSLLFAAPAVVALVFLWS